MRLLVTGSRDFTDKARIRNKLIELNKEYGPLVVGHGAAKGADSIAAEEAAALGLEVIAFPADWKSHGRAAGPIRNTTMLKEFDPDMVVYFTDDLGASKGTKDMVNKSQKAGVKVIRG